MAFEIVKADEFEIGDAERDAVASYVGLCGDEPLLDFYISAAIEHVESYMLKPLRKMTIRYTTTKTGLVSMPFGCDIEIDSVRRHVQSGYSGYTDYNSDVYGYGFSYEFGHGCCDFNSRDSTLCLPALCRKCEYYVIDYTSKPFTQKRHTVMMAIMKVANALYDDEPIPDLARLLLGVAPSTLERFALNIGFSGKVAS